MLFTLDDRRVPVRIATRTLIVQGQPAMAKYDPASGCIWLSDQLPRHERRRKLFHELRHFWRDVRGLSRDDEEDADDVAEMMILFNDQLAAQGGNDTLEAMVPEMVKRIARPQNGQMLLTNVNCGHCCAAMAVGSIGNGPPSWDADFSVFVMDRGIQCEVCDSVTVWRETCTGEGTPTGGIIPSPPPRVLDRAAAGEWVEQHQAACRARMARA